jgi:predicted TIM-barrel fold metal-dependent hydrolase
MARSKDETRIDRRAFLAGVAAVAVPAAHAQAAEIPIIDCHIHLFDRTRAQNAFPGGGRKGPDAPPGAGRKGPPDAAKGGPPRPPRRSVMTPALYRDIAMPQGIKGAIAIEASPRLDENDWVLETIEKDTIMVGYIGDLEPDKPDYAQYLEKYHKNPLFLGIRYGTLWNRDLGAMLSNPDFVSGLKLLAQAGMVLETANQTPGLIDATLRTADKVPGLRIVIDHLPQMEPPSDSAARSAYESNLRELAKRPQVWLKVSEVIRRVNGEVPTDPNFYKPRLDELYGIFGEDHVLFGSDFPNSDQWGDYQTVMSLVRPYFMAKGRAVAEKYFWKNSVAAYRWVKRETAQPRLA